MPDEIQPNAVQPVPAAKVEKTRWPFPLIWIVPLLALGLAGYFFYQRHQDQGVEIVIRFTDGSGLKPSQTAVTIAGVTVGHVHDLELDSDHKTVLVHVRLETKDAYLAKAGTQFWVVRPELSLSSISGLNTIVSGPYIDVRPGDGGETHDFTGLEQPPKSNVPGIRLLLYADQIGHVSADSRVDFRGIQVGTVLDVRLGKDTKTAPAVDILIWDQYKGLVASNSLFWVDSGADVKGSILSGIQLQLGSVQSLLLGSIAFRTPEENPGTPVKDGTTFNLAEKEPKPDVPGVHLLLYADQIGHVSADSRVNFRGIQVGSVQDVRLGDDASSAAVDIVIWDRYKNIVRTKSVFWIDNGADLKGSLLGGVQLQLGSVQSLLVGSVEFATPEKEYGQVVKNGDLFELHDKPQDAWLHWHAPIQIVPPQKALLKVPPATVPSSNPNGQSPAGGGDAGKLLPQLKHE
jgi:paraquat-inducible protein B